MGAKEYYRILRVPRTADTREIKKAYRKLAHKYHPDVCKDKGAEDNFKQINEAYSVLSNAQKRREYDNSGFRMETPEPEGPGTGKGEADGSSAADIFGSADFSDFFGESRQQSVPKHEPGTDLVMQVQVPLGDALNGTDRDIDVIHTEHCPACAGTGSATKRVSTCHRCRGTGKMRVTANSPFTDFLRMTPCTYCGGKGRIPDKVCSHCKGSGHTRVKRRISVHIPAGTDNGTKLRVKGFGEAGDFGAANGDLFVEVVVKPHDRFTRNGDNLETFVEISPAQAALGTVLEVETIDSRHIDLRVPAGTDNDTPFTIRGEGLRHGDHTGDLLVRVKIITPKHLSREQQDLYQKLADLEGSQTGGSGFFSWIAGKKKGKKGE